MNDIQKFQNPSLPDIDPAKLNLPESKVTDKEYVVQTIHVPLALDHRIGFIIYMSVMFIFLVLCFLIFMGLTHKIMLLLEDIHALKTVATYEAASLQNNAIAIKQAAYKLEQLRRLEIQNQVVTQQNIYGCTVAVIFVTVLFLALGAK